MKPDAGIQVVRVPRAPAAGMTMIELVIVMVLVSALAFFAIPRLNTTGLQVVPVAEQMAAEIRYAQNLAFTRSQPHQFTIDVGSESYSISSNGSPVGLSNGESSGSFAGLSVSGPTSISFEPRFGRPDAGGSISVSGGGTTATIEIEGETGYVYVVD